MQLNKGDEIANTIIAEHENKLMSSNSNFMRFYPDSFRTPFYKNHLYSSPQSEMYEIKHCSEEKEKSNVQNFKLYRNKSD